MAKKLTAEERIQKSHLNIMRHPSFAAWAGLLFIGGWEIDDNHPTASVNHTGLVQYGRAFIDGCDSVGGVDAEVNYIVLHETGHKALLHVTRAYKLYQINRSAAAEAVDQVVNNMIEDIDPSHQFARMPHHVPGHFDRKYAGMALQEVFRDIMQNGGGKGKGQDEHDFKKIEEGDKDPTQKDDQQVQSLEKQIEDSLRTGSYMAGKMGGTQSRTLADMMTPQVDWREQLREFVQDTCQGEGDASWVRPHRRFVGVDVYFPTSVSEVIGEITCYVDTSGSIGQRELSAMLSEVVSIAETVHPTGIRLVYWGDDIEGEEFYRPDQYEDLLRVTKPIGGGGTSGGPKIAEHANKMENIQCAIVLTDGGLYGGWGEWTVPVLFAITTRTMAPCGKTVHIDLGY